MTPCTVPGGGSAASNATVVKSHAPESRSGINFCATCPLADLDATDFLKSKTRRGPGLSVFFIRQNVVLGLVLCTGTEKAGQNRCTRSSQLRFRGGIGVRCSKLNERTREDQSRAGLQLLQIPQKPRRKGMV